MTDEKIETIKGNIRKIPELMKAVGMVKSGAISKKNMERMLRGVFKALPTPDTTPDEIITAFNELVEAD